MFRASNGDMTIHFIGIGGIGMSGIVEILHLLGYVVQGSDKSDSQNTKRLERLGIKTFIGHDTSNLENADIVVYSSAIHQDNPEMVRARELKLPCLPRAEMLSQIVRFKKSVVVAGSHGKTTVTSICAALLEMASYDPTVVNGGVIHSYNTNAKLGNGEWAVIESDESDGSFVQFFPTIGIITNIDKEHITHYGSFANLKSAFKTFLNNLPFYGFGIVSIDDENTREVIEDIKDRKIITYSIERDATYRAVNIIRDKIGSTYDILHDGKIVGSVTIPLMGDHNIKNSLAAFAMAHELGIDLGVIKSTLASFTGVNRRFTNIGNIGDAMCIDDYAHHPTEIKALLKAARQKVSGKITIVCQPHRFTRLNLLFDEFVECFDEADQILIMPVYKADDKESAQITSKELFEALKNSGKNVEFIEDQESLKFYILDQKKNLTHEDIILFAGAGSISKWAREIVSDIGIPS